MCTPNIAIKNRWETDDQPLDVDPIFRKNNLLTDHAPGFLSFSATPCGQPTLHH